MKNTDFDSIKEKFDNCGVNAPDSLSESAILEKLPAQPVEALPPKKSKKKLVAGVSAVAAAAVVTAGAVTFTSILHQAPPSQPQQSASQTAALRSFQSRSELKTAVSDVLRVNQARRRGYRYELVEYDAAEADGAVADGSKSGGSSASSSYHNSTYVQTVGVDEADRVKTTEKYIFYLNRYDTITVFSAEGKDAKKVAALESENGDIDDFFVVGDRLVTLGSEWAYDAAADDYYYGESLTAATVYDISDIGNIRRLGAFSQSGNYLSSRMIGDTLYLVSNQYIADEGDIPTVRRAGGSTPDSATPDEVPVEDIYAVQTPADNTFLVVSSIDTANGAQTTVTKAILGSAGIIYCNQDNLYVTASAYSPTVYRNLIDYVSVDDIVQNDIISGIGELFGAVSQEPSWEPAQTQIIKISLRKDVEFVASNKVSGTVNNQYSLDEYNGNLRIATTSTDGDGKDVNNLFVLDGELNRLGAVTGFAKDESIQAVRYLGETAYVITYEQTDPLFVIDTADPSHPAIMGEVKISGFSTLLVPIDENTLLGIGYHTEEHADDGIDMEIQEGVKIVTFDVTDKTNPQVLDTKVYAGYDSAVQTNPKALLVNFERGDYTIPMHYRTYLHTDSYVSGNASKGDTFGTLTFRIDNGKINVIDEYVSDKFSGEYDNMERCVCVGDNIYLLGTHGYDESGNRENSADIDCVAYR